MTLPNPMSKANFDTDADDPRQSRAELANNVDVFNQLLAHLQASSITNTPATAGEGVEVISGALRVRLDGNTIIRSGSGIAVNVGQGAGQIVRLDAVGRLPAIDGSQLLGVQGVPTGTIAAYAGPSAPTNWLLCNGAEISRTGEATLFAVIGTTYGVGDGVNTFNLPDLRGRAAIGAGTGPGLTARTLGQSLGTETVQLTTAQLPSHTHSMASAGGHTHTVNFTSAAVGGVGSTQPLGNNQSSPTATDTTSSSGAHTHTINATGSNQAHPNMQPSAVVNYIIKR